MATDFSSQINAIYQAVQYRTGPSADVAVYNAALQSGALTIAQVQAGVITDTYTVNFVNPVIREFQAAFGRVPDQAGAAFWTTEVAAGRQTLTTLGTTFANSAEFTARFGATATTTANVALVTALYTNVYGRAPDAAGLAFWAGSGLTAAGLLNAFANAAEFIAQTGAAVTAFQQAEIAGNAPTSGSLFGAGGTPVAGTTSALTSGVDIIPGTAGDDTIIGVFDAVTATLRTLNAGDSITGGAGNDTLKVVVANTGGAVLTGATVTGVEKISFQNASGAGVTLDASTTAGVNTIESLNSTALSTVAVTNLATGAKVVASGSASAATVNFAYQLAGDAVTVGVDGGVNGVTVAATAGTATTATINSTGSANGNVTVGADTFTLTAASATINKLTVNAAANLRATLTAADFAATGADLTVAGTAASVDLGTLGVYKTIDASGLSAGGLTVQTGATLTKFTGGAGADVLTLAAGPSSGTAINLGAGNDALQGLLAAAPGVTVTIDGGAGTDTVAADLINAGNAANFKAFEQVDMAGMLAADNLDVTLLTASTLTGVVISNQAAVGAAATVSNIAAATANNVFVSATLAAQTETLSYSGATGAADAVNVTFNNTTSFVAAPVAANVFAGTVTTKNIEQLNITSGGTNTWNQYTATDDNLQKVVITGAQNLNFALTSQATFTPSGGSATTSSALTSVDGSAATGNLVLTFVAPTALAQSGLTVKGGSGTDTITVVTTGTVGGVSSSAPTLTGGAGNDSFVLSGAVTQSATSPQTATITDFAKGDSITLANATAGFTTTKVDVSAASTLLEAITLSMGAINTEHWFQFAGNTYVTANDGTLAVGTGDNVVKLTGLLDLSTSGLAATVLTFA